MPDFFGQIAAFFVQGLPLPVEAGFGCSQSVASNVFVRTKLYLLLLKKNNEPL